MCGAGAPARENSVRVETGLAQSPARYATPTSPSHELNDHPRPGSTPALAASSPDKSAGCAPYSAPAPAVRWQRKDAAGKPASTACKPGNRTPDRAVPGPPHTELA